IVERELERLIGVGRAKFDAARLARILAMKKKMKKAHDMLHSCSGASATLLSAPIGTPQAKGGLQNQAAARDADEGGTQPLLHSRFQGPRRENRDDRDQSCTRCGGERPLRPRSEE